MAKNELNAAKKLKVLELLAAGETYSAIAGQIGCSVQNIKYYADHYKDRLKKLETENEDQVMRRGYANKVFRVRKLNRLAERLEKEIEGLPMGPAKTGPDGKTAEILNGHGLWLRDVKFGPKGGMVNLEVYASGLVGDYLKVLNDIAKEKGERINKAEIEVKGNILTDFVNLRADDV